MPAPYPPSAALGRRDDAHTPRGARVAPDGSFSTESAAGAWRSAMRRVPLGLDLGERPGGRSAGGEPFDEGAGRWSHTRRRGIRPRPALLTNRQAPTMTLRLAEDTLFSD